MLCPGRRIGMTLVPVGIMYVPSHRLCRRPSYLNLLALSFHFKSFPFGWEDDQDGFRGHVFVSDDQSTAILAIKGTTLQGPTSKKDKFNDNLLFSCCCAWVDFSWVFSTVCKCYAFNWRCDESCLSDALIQDSLFYSVGVVSNRYTCSKLQQSLNQPFVTGHCQQSDSPISVVKYLARRPLTWRCPCLSSGLHFWSSIRCLRESRRTPRSDSSASPSSSALTR